MGASTLISWTDATWNFAVGCSKVDSDCKFCYMYRMSLKGKRYNPKTVRKTTTVFNLPLKLEKPSLVFAPSMSDPFHVDIDSFRHEVFDIIHKCPQHTFQLLTKRPERILDNLPKFWDELRGHVWLGTSIGSPTGLQRAFELLKARKVADTLFLSLEPLHQKLDFKDLHDPASISGDDQFEILRKFDWVIIGGESGNESGPYRYRPCQLDWIETIVEQCMEAKVPVYVKQLGTYLSGQLGLKHRHGEDIEEWPEHLRIRQMPYCYKGVRDYQNGVIK
ncbi:MAG: DUF5131 family protein [Cyclobacteriaceae bacterium]